MFDVIDDITRENLAVYEASPGRVREDVSQEAQVAHDYRGRLVYELLQNADDAMESHGGHDDRILFRITDEALWVANTGRPFMEEDVRGLCGLGASSKANAPVGGRRASIGHKGLGFKSVLEITEAPVALSTTYGFQLGEGHARVAVGSAFTQLGREVPSRLPAMRFPAPVDTLPEWWHDLEDEYNTAFFFPFSDRVDAADRIRLADKLLALPVTTVLFLKHLEEVRVVVDQSNRSETATWRATREIDVSGAWRATSGLNTSGLYHVTIEASEQHASRFLLAHDEVDIGSHREGLSGPAWDGVDVAEVSVAALDPCAHEEPTPSTWRNFHVFLPTAERNPYPFLVNGAFTTDLSRQQLKIGTSPRDYNAHLVRSAAQLFRRSLAPRLANHAPTSLLRALQCAGEWPDESAAGHLHRAVRDELVDLAFVPCGEDHQTLPDTLATPPELGDHGGRVADVLEPGAELDGARLPDPELCAEPYTSAMTAHGARALDPDETLLLLALRVSPERSKLTEAESGGFWLDPVVELAAELWSNAAPEVREQLETRARDLPLFPVRLRDDETVERITLGEADAFYPPQSARQDLPLAGLAFMLHDVCWGSLQPNERKRVLDDRMTVWKALFDVSDFRFEEVMRAAVLPALARTRDEQTGALREALQSVEALAAICQLAGGQTKPDRPLRYQRLQSDRALFNLSRLQVPCVVDGQEVWEPAFKVYFGREWYPDGSVDNVVDALSDPTRLQLPKLAPPERFYGLLEQYQDVQGDTAGTDESDEDDEIGLDEDFDQPIETTERDRWVDFLSWIGVNRCLRPVHFHDVMDEHRWLSTKDLAQPKGWAFVNLGNEWEEYEAHIRGQLEGRPEAEGAVPYLYECHDLEGLGEIIAQAQRDPTAAIARALWRHLVQHWETYQRFTTLELAMVGSDKYPGQRAKPPRAMPEERLELGDDFWVHRQRRAGVCPTSHGPRRADVAWMPGSEVDRRFARQRGRRAGEILPLLDVGDGLPPRALRSLADRFGVRLDLNPSTFTVADAAGVCRRLADLYGPEGEPVNAESLRRTIRPTYRQVFALLSGVAAPEEPIADTPMLAEGPDGFRFRPAREVLYARSPGTKERSGVGDQLPTFVIEADPAANRPLTAIFGMQTLEDALEWAPNPGDPALGGSDLDEFRIQLRALAPWLLARLRADRADAANDDQAALRGFIECVEPVTELELSCHRDGRVVTAAQPRTYYVSNARPGESLQASSPGTVRRGPRTPMPGRRWLWRWPTHSGSTTSRPSSPSSTLTTGGVGDCWTLQARPASTTRSWRSFVRRSPCWIRSPSPATTLRPAVQ
jgi:hypothetical protein